jgi:hypothetical protein
MLEKHILDALKANPQSISSDVTLGPLALLPGTWQSTIGLNMIALPSPVPVAADISLFYRLLVNQYNETLQFEQVVPAVANRGIVPWIINDPADQTIIPLKYYQSINQIQAKSIPIGNSSLGITPLHFEPGWFFHIANETTNGMDIARLGTIPHGNSVLALGTSSQTSGAAPIPSINGLPIGIDQNLDNSRLQPYKFFHDKPFLGIFDPTSPNDYLQTTLNNYLNDYNVLQTTELPFVTPSPGIVNTPFIIKQANATSLQSTFWIRELEKKDGTGSLLLLQYSQTVILEFSPNPALSSVQFPHVSINTLTKVS